MEETIWVSVHVHSVHSTTDKTTLFEFSLVRSQSQGLFDFSVIIESSL